jgi:hypothetical protein
VIHRILAAVGVALSLLLVGGGVASAATTTKTVSATVNPGETKVVTASCPSGTRFSGISSKTTNASVIESVIAGSLKATVKGYTWTTQQGTYTAVITCKS